MTEKYYLRERKDTFDECVERTMCEAGVPRERAQALCDILK